MQTPAVLRIHKFTKTNLFGNANRLDIEGLINSIKDKASRSLVIKLIAETH